MKCIYTNAPVHIGDCSELMCGIYTDTAVSCAHELICICCIYMVFERHICSWHIHDNNI